VATLVCAECNRSADATARGWKAYLAGGLDDEDEAVEVVCLCPICAEREFGWSRSPGS
jgi:hypothetical protein